MYFDTFQTGFTLRLNGGSWCGCDYVYNMFKICPIVVTILSNRFETDFEPATGMRIEVMLKNCLKHRHSCINRF